MAPFSLFTRSRSALLLVSGALMAVLVVGAPVAAWARRSGIAAAGCDGCHSGGRVPTVSLTANPMSPAVGQAVTLTISVSHANGAVAGFFLTTDYVTKGMFRAIETGTLATAVGVTHTTPRTGAGDATVFKVEWSAQEATGVNFSVYALAANGDGTSRGDAGGMAGLGLLVGCAGQTYYLDQDADGIGTSDTSYPTRKECVRPPGYSATSGDCDDFNAKINPAATELCDGKDNDCDGKKDEDIVDQTFCEDKDGDGHGVLGAATRTDCTASAGFGDCNGDCNDNNAAVFPGATEICDGRDNNCNGNIDEGVRLACGVGWCRRQAEGCSSSCTPGPPQAETCNYFDDDCDGVMDNGTDAALCGASGLACVLGQCIPDDGGAPSGGTSGGNGGRIGSGGGGGSATGGAGAGAIGAGGASGAAAAGGGTTGGCAVGPGAPGARRLTTALTVHSFLTSLVIGLLAVLLRGRAPAPAREGTGGGRRHASGASKGASKPSSRAPAVALERACVKGRARHSFGLRQDRSL